MNRYRLFFALAGAAALLTVACTSSDPTPTPTAAAPTATPTTVLAPVTPTNDQSGGGSMGGDDQIAMGPHGDLVVSLHALNDSEQSGIAVLTASSGQTDVTLIATSGISELNHIHAGSCMDLGGVEYPLTNMEDGTSVTTIDVELATLMKGGLAINLHKAGEPAVYTACGEIPTEDGAVTVHLKEMNDSGQVGLATLTGRGDQTEVVLYATSGISELNHIHAGSCMDLGGVEYGLANMEGGISVTVVDATLESLTKGGLAVNLHKQGDPAAYTSCGDIPTTEMMGGGDQTSSSPAILQAEIKNFALPDLTIEVGTTVTWTQRDPVTHTTTSGVNGSFDGSGWDSGRLNSGQSFSRTFNEVGIFPYTCTIHPSMNGTVTVVAGGNGTSATTNDSSSDTGGGSDY